MNETNLTLRQKYLLNLINQSNGLSRQQVHQAVEITYHLSKATLIRDLSFLITQKLIKTQGKGKNTKYLSYAQNPLLRPFDMNQYFSIDPDERIETKKTFDFGVFANLKNLFSKVETEKIKSVQKSFNQQTQKLPRDILKKELERFTIELSWKSSRIEGNTYTLLETEKLVKEKMEAKGHQREEATMILNHKEAFEEILNNRKAFNKTTISGINQLHNVMVKGLSITLGIRKHPVGITGTVYKPLDNEFQIREALEKLVVLINKNENVLEKALVLNSMLSYIQPYSDGNKRTGRMLTNAILLAYDYYPLSYRSIDEEEYKKALILFYEQGSLFHLKRLFIEQLIFSYRTYFR